MIDGLTPRQIEVLEAIAAGARSLQAIADALEPPISRRTAEVYVAGIVERLPSDFEPDAPGFWRVVIFTSGEAQ